MIPPPPPPGPPPPPSFSAPNAKSSSKSDPNGRNMLLESIRNGKKLKKAPVINDRSAPIVANNNKSPLGAPSGGAGGSSPGGGGGGRANGLNVPPGLSGLFAGGMPKLKPVGASGTGSLGGGSRGNSNNNINKNDSNNYLNNNSTASNSSSNNSSNHSSPASLHHSPAKPSPPPVHSPAVCLNNSTESGERKSVTNFGKPSLAPKPPGMNGRPAKPHPPPKLPNLHIPPPPPMSNSSMGSAGSTESSPSTANYYNSSMSSTPATPPPGGVNRAHSMRMPKSASPTSTNAANLEYSRTMGRAAGRGFVAAGQPPPPPRIIPNGVPRVRASPLRPPTARPPPPPNKAPPGHPPPPPPAAAPPPPPHRTGPAPIPPQLRVNGSLGPLPPVPLGGPPPPPPTRNSSMRSINSASSITSVGSSSGSSSSSVYTGIDLESKFGHLFHKIEELPKPAPFSGILKNYPSKNAQSIKRQPAPQPPTQIQLGAKMWANNTSTC